MGDGIGSSSAPPNRLAAADRPRSEQLSSQATGKNPQPTGGETGGQTSQSEDSSLTDSDIQSREPAVSIAASAASLRVGDQISATVQGKDAEGRPLIDTKEARYALRPDSNLVTGDAVDLIVRDTAKLVTADLVRINHRTQETPPSVTLTIITLHKDFRSSPDTVDTAPSTPNRPPNESALTYAPPKTTVLPAPAASTPPSTELSAVSSATSQQAQFANQTRPEALSQQSPTPPLPAPKEAITADLQQGLITLPISTPALTSEGGAASLTIVDQSLGAQPALSVAQVQNISSLPFEALAKLQLPAQFFAGTTDGPSLITTDKGVYITAQPASPTLVGAILVVSKPVAQPTTPQRTEATTTAHGQAAPQTSAQPLADAVTKALDQLATPVKGQIANIEAASISPANAAIPLPPEVSDKAAFVASAKSYQATLTVNEAVSVTNQGQPTTVDVEARLIPQTATQAPVGSLPIDTVRILDSRLSAAGPVTDIRLSTAIGQINLTVPAASRPLAGDFVFITADTLADSPAEAFSYPVSGHIPPVNTAEQTSAVTDQQKAAPSFSSAAVEAAPAPVATTSSLLVANEVLAQSGAIPPLQPAPAIGAALSDSFRVDAQPLSPPTASFEDSVDYLAASTDPTAIVSKGAEGGAKLTNSILFFLTALKRGTPEALFGQQATDQLRQGNEALLTSLTRDLPGLQAAAHPESLGEWRQITLPFETRDTMASFLSFLFRETPVDRDGRSSGGPFGEEDAEKLIEFKMDVQFSILGDIALHGRILDRRFDLGVESPAPLAASLETELNDLFTTAIDANGFMGSLSFLRAGESS